MPTPSPKREDVWAIVPQIVLDRVAGFTVFHKDCLVVAAGNRPEDASTIVRMIHNPLLNRFKIIKVSPPTVDEWAEWMNRTYGDEWDKRTYVFLKRFSEEGYLLKVPKTPEGLEEYPTPRSWTWLALGLKEGFDSLEDICGFIGEEVGRKFDAFLKVNVDIDRLIDEPATFHTLSIDGKYMVSFMLASWIMQHTREWAKTYPLIDEMNKESKEYFVITCMSLKKNTLISFLRKLFEAKPSYRDLIREILLDIREMVKPA